MKRFNILIGALFLLVCTDTQAQIAQQYTMYTQNHYLINPAAAGNKDFLDVSLGFRRQWAGVSDAPSSFYATGHTALNQPKTFQRSALYTSGTQGVVQKKRSMGSLKHAVGAQLNSNTNGAFKRNQAMFTYALHLPVTRKMNLSFGVSAGLNNYGFDESKVTVLDINDPTYNAYADGENANKFNVNAGTYLYADKFFVGYSASNIIQNDLDIATSNSTATLNMQHNVMGGYRYPLTNDFELNTNVLAKIREANPLSYDVNLTLDYKRSLSAGLSYRSEDAVSILLGAQLTPLLKAGYAYDYTTSDIRDQSGGSHELFIGLTIF